MYILQQNCRRDPKCIYAIMETATTMAYDMVLIQEPAIGLEGCNITSGTFTLYKPTQTEKYNNRIARVWLAIHKQAEVERHILEERNDLSSSPDIQVFDVYEKVWKKENQESEEERNNKKAEKEKKKKIKRRKEKKKNKRKRKQNVFRQ
jgi:hypothetical protein